MKSIPLNIPILNMPIRLYKDISIVIGIFVMITFPQQAKAILLSDIAYHAMKQDITSHKDLFSISLQKPERDFATLSLRYKNHTYDVHYKRHSKSRLSIKLPIFFRHKNDQNSITIQGLDSKRSQVWQRHISLPVIDTSLLANITVIKPFETFRGNILFADSIERLSKDFLEPTGKENIVFVRTVDWNMQTTSVYFVENPDTKGPVHDAIGVYADLSKLYVFRPSQASWYSLTGPKNKHLPVNATCLHAWHDESHYSLEYHNEKLHLQFFSGECNTPHKPQVISHHPISLPQDIARKLGKNTISAYSLERSHNQDYYALLLKTHPEHTFMHRNIADDYILILKKDFSCDGAIAIANTYYSPRRNVAFFHTLEEFLIFQGERS